MPESELPRIQTFLSVFARRQAERCTELPGGFAVYDDTFAHSRANNQVIIDGAVDPGALPALADKALEHLPHRLISVIDDETGAACAGPLLRAGYTHSTFLVMLHTSPAPAGDKAEEVGLEAIRAPLARRWRGLLPGADDEVVRQLVDRREARRRGADGVHFLAARTDEAEVASWADLYLDPASGTAQIEDLITSEAHLRHGYGDAVLATALRKAADAGCGTRFLVTGATDWPHEWYGRRGFSAISRIHEFDRG
jgi:GNAT superfamily N-acetyltransferase